MELIPHNRLNDVSDGGLDTRDMRDLLDRVLDKGIVVDPASRLDMITDESPDHRNRFIVGSVDTDY